MKLKQITANKILQKTTNIKCYWKKSVGSIYEQNNPIFLNV